MGTKKGSRVVCPDFHFILEEGKLEILLATRWVTDEK